MPFIPHTPDDTAAMLKSVGAAHMDDLFADIPPAMRPKSFALPGGASEYETWPFSGTWRTATPPG